MRASPSATASRRAAGEVHGDQPLAGLELRIRRHRAGSGPLARRRTTRSDGPAGSSRTSAPAVPLRPPARRAAAPRRSTTPAIGSRRPWARPLAVAMPTRRPVNAPGPVPTTSPPSAARRDAAVREQRLDPGQELLAVPIAGRPGRAPISVPSGRAERDDHPRRGRVDGEDAGVRRAGHAAASQVAAA